MFPQDDMSDTQRAVMYWVVMFGKIHGPKTVHTPHVAQLVSCIQTGRFIKN